MVCHDEVTNRKGAPIVSDDEAAPRDGEKDNYYSYISTVLHYDTVDNTEYLSANKEQIKKFKPDFLQPAEKVIPKEITGTRQFTVAFCHMEGF